MTETERGEVQGLSDEIKEILDEILAVRKDLKGSDIIQLIEKKRAEGRGLLSDEGAARLVAEDLRVELESRALSKISIAALVSGLNDVTLTARVLVAWPVQEFQKRDGSQGKVMRLLLADGTGKVKAVLWDVKAQEFSNVSLQNRILRIIHGYTREGLAGEVELHVGDRTTLVISPGDVDEIAYPKLQELSFKVAEVKPEVAEVNLVGIVIAPPRLNTFTRDGREGRVLRTMIADQTGSIALVAWNERADQLGNLREGDALQIVNGRVRTDQTGMLELHIESRSLVTQLEQAQIEVSRPKTETARISDIRPSTRRANVLVEMVRVGELRETQRLDGGTVRLTNAIVGDETGYMAAAFWDDAAEVASKLKIGDRVLIRDVSVRERMGEVSISVGKMAEIVISKQSEDEQSQPPPIHKIKQLPSIIGLAVVEGKVIDEPTKREVTTSKGEQVSVTSLTVEDSSGRIRVSFWRDLADKALRLRAGTKIRTGGLRTRPGLGGELELASSALSWVNVLEQSSAAERPSWQELKQIIALEANEKTWVRGLLLDVGKGAKLQLSCPQCAGKMGWVENKLGKCESCGAEDRPKFSLQMNLNLDDGTGTVRAELKTNTDEGALSRLMNPAIAEMTERELPILELHPLTLGQFVGKRVEAYGTVVKNKDGKFELKLQRLILLD